MSVQWPGSPTRQEDERYEHPAMTRSHYDVSTTPPHYPPPHYPTDPPPTTAPYYRTTSLSSQTLHYYSPHGLP